MIIMTIYVSPQQKVYYANHGSHGDFLLVWISLPRRWRIHTRPVAGSDYWLTGRIRRFIIQNVFNALLIPRHSESLLRFCVGSLGSARTSWWVQPLRRQRRG